MKHIEPPHRHPARARGFMLIEVLVSILIFSIGVLALVGLQAKMTRAQSASKFRTDAAYMAKELMGMMWSDVKNLNQYGTCASHPPCKSWQDKVAQSLPGGDAKVSELDASSGKAKITIKWTQSSDGEHVYETTTFVKAN